MLSNKNPLVSIITTVKNGEKHLEQCIQSVINQDYKNIEYIMIDGGSTDNTIDIIKKYEKNISYWISEKDIGIYDGMNKGIKNATGYYICVLNADDYYTDNHQISIVMKRLINNNVEFVYSDAKILKINGEIKEKGSSPLSTDILLRNYIFHPTLICKKTVFTKIGLYNTNYMIAADYDFVLRLYLGNFKWEKVATFSVCIREGGMSYYNPKALEEYKSILKSYNLFTIKPKLNYYSILIKRKILQFNFFKNILSK
ncbi:MAG: glycosyltransferase family 2 protein [Bacteroidales bacterium]|nr:glycosyltransferase family 2 protein [Bacteroidales bacterium]